MYIQRHLEDQVREASAFYPVVMVCGLLVDEFQRVPSILLEKECFGYL